MGPDLLWVAVFVLGGLAIGLVTALVGVRKGGELWYWLGLYVFMVAAVLFLDVGHPFWTILLGSVLAGLAAAGVQTALLRWYRRNNPWYETAKRSRRQAAGGFFAFAALIGVLFGVVLGATAWGLSGLL